MEYAIYPFKDMRITQRHDEGNHRAHNIPFIDYSDKPWDEGSTDGGRQWFDPSNSFKIVEILGLNTTVTTNSVRLESVNKLKIPYQEEPVILEITLTHMNEETIKKIKVGQIIHPHELVIQEGKDGADANHFHCTANIGKYYGMKKNANGKWCFVYDKSLTPDEAFYIDPSFNRILNAKGYNFKEVPTMERVGNPVPRNTKVNQIEVLPTATSLRARKEPGTSGEVLGYINVGIYDIEDTEGAKDGYDWYKVQGMWIAYSPDWEVLLPKEEKTPEEIQIEYKIRILTAIDEFLDSLII